MLELYVFQKLFERNLVKYSSKFKICYFLTAAATSKALIRRKTNREKSEINYIFTIIRSIYRSEKWKTPPESPETREYLHVKNSKNNFFLLFLESFPLIISELRHVIMLELIKFKH